MRWTPQFAKVFLLITLVGGWSRAENFTPDQITFFETKIRPVLAENCYGCHGTKKQMNGLRLDSRAAIIKGSDYAKVVIPGDPEGSKLIHAVRQDKPGQVEPMPKDGKKLDQAQLDALAEWVKQGLPWPDEAAPKVAGAGVDAKDHWAFKPVVNPPQPTVAAQAQVYQPMDAWVIKKLEEKGLGLSPKTDRATRMKRLQIDLLGFPPTFDEVQAFVNDKEPKAYERLVDRLLASPHFGERWARYWLDVARYADTKGYVFQEERLYPFSYTYRDWVIRALNADMPYDQFLKYQIAADHVNPDQKENLAALGFLTLGRRFLNSEPDIIDDRLDVIFRGTQALTVGCARCHDHKFDPIPTADYYSLYGILASSMEPKDLPELPIKERTPEMDKFDQELAKKSEKLEEYRKSRFADLFNEATLEKYLKAAMESVGKPEKDLAPFAKERGLYLVALQRWKALLEKGSEPIFGFWKSLNSAPPTEFAQKAKQMLEAPDSATKYSPVVLQEMKSKPPGNGAELVKAYARLFAQASPMGNPVKPEFEPLKAELQSPQGLTSIKTEEIERFFTRPEREKMNEIKKEIDNFKATSPAAPPRAMAMIDKPQPVEPAVFIRGNPGRRGEQVPRQFLKVLSGPERKPFSKGSGRLELAEMIASKNNPLTARVFVNRVWGRLFGAPMIDTPSDYGVRTNAPANPELLDHLSAVFMEKNWSVKSLIREMVLSSTYQQTSSFRPEAAKVDPDNTLLWRMNRKRLDFEALRDSLLVVSGKADLKFYGKPVELFNAPYSNRRSIYGFIDRQNLPGTFRTFDFANPDSHAPKRFETTVPQQALYMLNNPFVQQLADHLLKQVSQGAPPAEKVRALIRRVLSREATEAEISGGVTFISQRTGSPQTGRAWSYGYGDWNPETKTMTFTALPHFANNRWSGSSQNPDPNIGWVQLTGGSGHPGETGKAAIRRWHADASGNVKLSGIVQLPSPNSQGIVARIVSSRIGLLGEWKVGPKGQADARVPSVAVQAGDTIDFILDCGGDTNSDSFQWNPKVRRVETNEVLALAEEDFSGPGADPWQSLAQALLCANEFVFVD